MHCHCGTNNRAPRWTFTDPCKPEVRPGAQEVSASPASLAAPAMNARDTTRVYIWRIDTGCGPTLFRKCHSNIAPCIITLELKAQQISPRRACKKSNAFDVVSMTTTIEKTINLKLCHFAAVYIYFLMRCTLTNKAVGHIRRASSKPPQRQQDPYPRPLWLLVGTPLAFGHKLAYRLLVQMSIFDILSILPSVFEYYVFDAPALICSWSSVCIRRIIYNFC